MATLTPPSGHGGQIRGLTSASQELGTGRFGRMFGSATDRPRHDDTVLKELAEIMTGVGLPGQPDDGKPIRKTGDVEPSDPGDENPTIPAGYTYFGQFVDHDITFDATSLNDQLVDPTATENFRTPALDLDSVYGNGPANQPYLYRFVKERTYLRIGEVIGGAVKAKGATETRHDHLRLAPEDAASPEIGCAAVLGDKRNDENKIVAQVHTAIIALHNRLMDDDALLQHMGAADLADRDARFQQTVKAVRWHYQWVVLFDYARNRICEPGMVDEVLNPTGLPRLGNYLSPKPEYAYIPVEFAIAAYRMGHSMVRPTYALNEIVGVVPPGDQKRIPIFKPGAQPLDAMNGFGQKIPGFWGIDWSFFLDGLTPPAAEPGKPPLAIPQPSYRLDATLVDPLRLLPEFDGAPVPFANLAFRNLLRSKINQLPSGEAVAAALGIVPMGFDELWSAGSGRHGQPIDEDRVDLAKLRADFGAKHRAALESHTPLWYYILREAELFGIHRTPGEPDPFGGQHLGPVGSRIVAETLIGLLWLDQTSFLHAKPAFRPILKGGAASDRFDLADLLRYALG